MQIHEIITEAPAVDTATRQARLARSQAARAGTTAASATAPTAKTSSRVMDLVKRMVASGNVSDSTVRANMMQKIGNAWPIIKFLGFSTIAYSIWQQYTAVDQLLTAKQISTEDADAAKRMIITQGVAAVIATSAFGRLIKIVTTLAGIRWFIRGIGLISSPLSAGLSVAVTIATEAGIIWLQQYLATKEGQEQLAYTVLYFIDPGTVWLWNAGPGKIFGEWKTISDAGAEKVSQAQSAALSKPGEKPAAGKTAAKPATSQAAQPTTEPEAAAKSSASADLINRYLDTGVPF